MGAGPITYVGSYAEDWVIEMNAVDPLAHIYAGIMKTYSITPPVKTVFSFAEDISARYEPNSFDPHNLHQCFGSCNLAGMGNYGNDDVPQDWRSNLSGAQAK